MNLKDIILKACEEDTEAVDFFIKISDLYSDRGDLERALNIKEVILSLPLGKNKKEEILLGLSKDFHRAGMYDNALSVLDELFVTTEEKDEIIELQSHIYIELKEWAKVIEIQKRKKNKNPDCLLFALCNLSKDMLIEGDKKRAVLLLKEAELISKDHPHILFHWVDIYITENNMQEITAIGQKIRQSSPVFFGVYLEKIMVYKAFNKDIFELTLKHIKEKRQDMFVIYQLARYLFEAERYEDLVKLLESCVENINRAALLRLYIMALQRLDRSMNKRFYQSFINLIPEETRWFRCKFCGYESENYSFSCIRCNSINSFVLLERNE